MTSALSSYGAGSSTTSGIFVMTVEGDFINDPEFHAICMQRLVTLPWYDSETYTAVDAFTLQAVGALDKDFFVGSKSKHTMPTLSAEVERALRVGIGRYGAGVLKVWPGQPVLRTHPDTVRADLKFSDGSGNNTIIDVVLAQNDAQKPAGKGADLVLAPLQHAINRNAKQYDDFPGVRFFTLTTLGAGGNHARGICSSIGDKYANGQIMDRLKIKRAYIIGRIKAIVGAFLQRARAQMFLQGSAQATPGSLLGCYFIEKMLLGNIGAASFAVRIPRRHHWFVEEEDQQETDKQKDDDDDDDDGGGRRGQKGRRITLIPDNDIETRIAGLTTLVDLEDFAAQLGKKQGTKNHSLLIRRGREIIEVQMAAGKHIRPSKYLLSSTQARLSLNVSPSTKRKGSSSQSSQSSAAKKQKTDDGDREWNDRSKPKKKNCGSKGRQQRARSQSDGQSQVSTQGEATTQSQDESQTQTQTLQDLEEAQPSQQRSKSKRRRQ